MKPTRPSSPASIAARMARMPAIRRALWPTVTLIAVGALQRLDLQPLLERAGDRLLGVDVLAGLRDLARNRQVLLVRHREDDALDRRVGQHGGEVGHDRDAEFLRKGRALLLGAAVAGDDLDCVRAKAGAGQHLRPAAEADDSNLDGSCRPRGSF